jgi:hypothetical protein
VESDASAPRVPARWRRRRLTKRSSQRLHRVMRRMSMLTSVLSQLPLAPAGAVAELELVRRSEPAHPYSRHRCCRRSDFRSWRLPRPHLRCSGLDPRRDGAGRASCPELERYRLIYLLHHATDQQLSHTTLPWAQFWLLDHIRATLGGAALGILICVLASPELYRRRANGTPASNQSLESTAGRSDV